MLLLEVDDFFIGSANPEARAWLRQVLEFRFRFGKYRDCQAGPVDYAGRRVTMGPQKAVVDMEKYILVEIRPISVLKGRLSSKGTPLENDEFNLLRSL
eukprot:7627891-Pyramimonas_sp.AAC.1